MKNKVGILFGVVLLLSALVLVWSPFSVFLAADSCLDSGGSFNYSAAVCDFQQSHPYVPPSHSMRFSLASVLALLGLAVAIVSWRRNRGAQSNAL